MLRVGAAIGGLLDDAEQVVQRMETMQAMLVSILEDLKSGKASIEDVEITRHPQTGEVVSVSVDNDD